MKLSELSYNLPKNLIANSPVSPRDHSRLMVLDRETLSITHKHFYDLSDILRSGDVLVLNDTKVYPARLFGKKGSGGKVEVLFLKEANNNVWEILGSNIPSVGSKIYFTNFYSKVLKKGLGTATVEVHLKGQNMLTTLLAQGSTPIPPYIKSSTTEKTLRKSYQTVFAEKSGSVAAPTAGLHFTKSLLSELKDKGIVIEYVTLHVGPGTFLPIKEADITKHQMHSEYYSVSQNTYGRLRDAKAKGKRIIAVGTTSARVLETVANTKKLSGETDIFIHPPYKFKLVDSLITNFHLPHSTLLALISAFTTKPNAKHEFKDFKSSLTGKAYRDAIKKNYRFYSFGDAMLIQ